MEHYFSEEQKSTLKIKEIKLEIFNKVFDFEIPSGVFSKKKLDRGTEVLIKYSDIKKKKKVLDLGCGWGAIGIILAKEYNLNITFSDINKRALYFTKKNAKNNNIDGGFILSNLYEDIDQKFDIILSNLPQHAGKSIYMKIIEDAPKYLNTKGTLQVVIRRNKGGNSVEEKMREVFGNCKIIAKKSGYAIYLSENLN